MEATRKRKRPETAEIAARVDVKAGNGLSLSEREKSLPPPLLPPRRLQPPEEEVEEFYAILRRTRDAVKYFEKNGYGIGGGRSGGLRALETELLSCDGVGCNLEQNVGEADGVSNAVSLDLNVMPEGESNND
ncbi:hypothetical protein Ancab_029128 [Ancistrocladus abbreviatus]